MVIPVIDRISRERNKPRPVFLPKPRLNKPERVVDKVIEYLLEEEVCKYLCLRPVYDDLHVTEREGGIVFPDTRGYILPTR
jgi:hypothetical protein